MSAFFYYPCASKDGSPVKLLGRTLQHFLYTDQDYTFDILNGALLGRSAAPGLLEEWTRTGRLLSGSRPPTAELFLHYGPGQVVSRAERSPLAALPGFLSELRFPRHPGPNAENHGLPLLTLTFVKGDAIATFRELLARQLHPGGVACICPGMSFGGNRATYADELAATLAELPAPPAYYLRDEQSYGHALPAWEATHYGPGETHLVNTATRKNVPVTLCRI